MSRLDEPGWVVAPAAVLRDLMREQDLTVHMMAGNVGDDRRPEAAGLIEDVLGRQPLRVRHAVVLAAATGVMPRFWLDLERAYRDGLAAGHMDVSRTPDLLELPGSGPPWCSRCLAVIRNPDRDHKRGCGRAGLVGDSQAARQ